MNYNIQYRLIYSIFLDPDNRFYIIKLNGVFLISQQLLHENEDIALNALTTLIFLYAPETQASITSPEIICKALSYLNNPDPRFTNLAKIFLQDFCTPEQVSRAESTSGLNGA